MIFITPNDDNVELKQKIIDISYRVIKNFLVNCPPKWKKLFKNIFKHKCEIIIKKNQKRYWGWACYDEDEDTGKRTYEINYIQEIEKLNKKQMYFIIAHEICHCLDFIIRGDSHMIECFMKFVE